jgi:hypothetical protein
MARVVHALEREQRQIYTRSGKRGTDEEKR